MANVLRVSSPKLNFMKLLFDKFNDVWAFKMGLDAVLSGE
jgi:hypothetical protein